MGEYSRCESWKCLAYNGRGLIAYEKIINNICKQLVARMIVNTMAGRQSQVKKLYEEYFRERYLHVPVEEILRAKREASV